jgi:hypothetical protein
MRVVARMTSDGQAVERLRDYLRTLTPETRAMLAAELERGVPAGEGYPGNDLILQELRRTIPAAGPPAVGRMGEAARMFFAPVEPFVIDDAADHARAGRIARASLDPLWGSIAPCRPTTASRPSSVRAHCRIAPSFASAKPRRQ